MNKFKDAIATITGKDIIEEEAPKKKSAPKKAETKSEPKETKVTEAEKKPEKAEKAPERKPVATTDAIFEAYDYAANKDKLSDDVRTALKTGALSKDLRKLLQVMFDKEAVRELVAAQGDVRPPAPSPDETFTDFYFINEETGLDCTKVAEGLLESGTSLEDLEKFNIKLRVVKKRKLDNSEIGEASAEEYEKVKNQLIEGAKEASKTE